MTEFVKRNFTILLLKYKEELLDEIDDGRINRNSIGNKITELYDNIRYDEMQKCLTCQIFCLPSWYIYGMIILCCFAHTQLQNEMQFCKMRCNFVN